MPPLNREVWVGIAQPYAFPLLVSGGAAAGFDLTTVTVAVVKVTRPDGARVIWAATISIQTADTLVGQHIHAADGSDAPLAGRYFFRIRMTVPGGYVYSDTEFFDVFTPQA